MRRAALHPPLALAAMLLAAAPARAVEIRIIPLVASDVVYNPHDQMLYVSVPGLAPLHGNTITRVDPVSGAIGPSIPIGSEPRKLALASDGSVLWVGLDGAAAIRKVDLGSFTAGPQHPLGSDPFLGSFYAEDIDVLPGTPNSVAISLRNQGFSPRHMGVAVYDEGVRRPTVTPGHTGSNIIVFSSTANRLYGQNIETTEFGFRRMNITASGVTVLDVTGNLFGGFGGDIFHDGGRVYSTGGEVVDPEARVLLGRFPFPNFDYPSAMVPDGPRAYFAGTQFFGSGEVRIQSFDTQTFTPRFAYPLSGVRGTATALRRWGPDGLALRTDDGTLVVLSDIESPPTCDVALTKTDDRDPVAVDEYIYYRLRVANRGDAAAEQVTIRDAIPTLTSFGFASHPRGFCFDSLGTIVCSASAALAPRDSFEILVGLLALATGTAVNSAVATSTTPDRNPMNNTASETTQIRERGFDRPDLYVAFESPPPAEIVEGESFDCAILVGNRGPGDATETRLFGFFQGASATVEMLSGPMACTQTSVQSIACSLGAFAAGRTARFAFRVRTDSPGYLGANVSVLAREQDGNFGDNFLSTYTLVWPSALRLIDNLGTAVARLDLNRGQHRVLSRRLAAARSAVARQDTAAACGELQSFQEWMERWTGRALNLDHAYALSVQCRMIQGLLDCFGPPPGTPAPGTPVQTVGRGRAGSNPILHSEQPASETSAADDPLVDAIDAGIPGALGLRTGSDASSSAALIAMPASGVARLDLLDLQGRAIRSVFEGTLPAGLHAVRWDARELPSGIYFYRLTALGQQAMSKVAVVR